MGGVIEVGGIWCRYEGMERASSVGVFMYSMCWAIYLLLPFFSVQNRIKQGLFCTKHAAQTFTPPCSCTSDPFVKLA